MEWNLPCGLDCWTVFGLTWILLGLPLNFHVLPSRSFGNWSVRSFMSLSISSCICLPEMIPSFGIGLSLTFVIHQLVSACSETSSDAPSGCSFTMRNLRAYSFPSSDCSLSSSRIHTNVSICALFSGAIYTFVLPLIGRGYLVPKGLNCLDVVTNLQYGLIFNQSNLFNNVLVSPVSRCCYKLYCAFLYMVFCSTDKDGSSNTFLSLFS